MNDGQYYRLAIAMHPGDRLLLKAYALFLVEYVGYDQFAALRAALRYRRSCVTVQDGLNQASSR